MNTVTTPDIDILAERVQRAKSKVRDYKHGYVTGQLSYDELAQAGKELSVAMFEYSRAKFPDVKARRIPYQSIIR
jgi:hypothetical protein